MSGVTPGFQRLLDTDKYGLACQVTLLEEEVAALKDRLTVSAGDTDAPPRLCVDCYWCDSNHRYRSQWTCHISDAQPNLLDGRVWYDRGYLCSDSREPTRILPSEGWAKCKCGPAGRYWKAVHS